MVRLLNESDDFPRSLAGAGSRQIDGRARAKHRAHGITSCDLRPRRRSVNRPIGPIPSPANDNIVRGVDDFSRLESETRRSWRQTSFARRDMARKQRDFARFEHVQRCPRPRVDLYEPDRVGRNQKIGAVESDEIQFRSNYSDGAADFLCLRWVHVDRSGGAAIAKRRRWRWRRPLHAETNNFRFFFAREE